MVAEPEVGWKRWEKDNYFLGIRTSTVFNKRTLFYTTSTETGFSLTIHTRGKPTMGIFSKGRIQQ
jgi:hypothetical protein